MNRQGARSSWEAERKGAFPRSQSCTGVTTQHRGRERVPGDEEVQAPGIKRAIHTDELCRPGTSCQNRGGEDSCCLASFPPRPSNHHEQETQEGEALEVARPLGALQSGDHPGPHPPVCSSGSWLLIQEDRTRRSRHPAM